MKKYELIELNEYENYLLLLTNDDIYYLYDEIKSKIKNNKILVDMFYRNGFSFNRFVELIFNEGKVVTRVVNPRSVSEPIKESSHTFFKSNKDYLDKSTLSKSIKNFVYAS